MFSLQQRDKCVIQFKRALDSVEKGIQEGGIHFVSRCGVVVVEWIHSQGDGCTLAEVYIEILQFGRLTNIFVNMFSLSNNFCIIIIQCWIRNIKGPNNLVFVASCVWWLGQYNFSPQDRRS
jgi:hypothetical protein